jgi:uncharacterized protein (DUF1697 family)
VIFNSSEKDPGKLTKKIEDHLCKKLGYEVLVMLRTVNELEKIVKNNPFSKVKLDNNIKLYLTFLQTESSIELIRSLKELKNDIQDSKIKNREVYTSYRRDIVKNPFSNNQIEKKLILSGTTRNWSVVDKILDLARE